jgi:hypothetical protein
MSATNFRKDESLDRLADILNVAQFISFVPGERCVQGYSRVVGYSPNHVFGSIEESLTILLDRSVNSSINIRSFKPDDARSHEFVYGIKDLLTAEAHLSRIIDAGFHVIVNETIDVHDGGVSGVLQGGIIEFSPDDTPRCVEKPGTVSIDRHWGRDILQSVYGFALPFDFDDSHRLEFSVHPRPCGWRQTHILGWELENVGALDIKPMLAWPNNFSRLIGDKAFGLLVASAIGLPVPMTTVISRRVAPFTFGTATGSAERWIRTCPTEQVPGKYTTHHGWLDPFKLLAQEDPSGTEISSVLAQHAVRAKFSGALIVDSSGSPVIEGTEGEGESLMLGITQPQALPEHIVSDVMSLFKRTFDLLGAVRFEWVHDGVEVWIVQLHRGGTNSHNNVIVPGNVAKWHDFNIALGLPLLRELLIALPESEGVSIIGQVGLTSHVADVLRKGKRAARIRS